MSKLYDLFRQSVFALAKTMVIKHHTAATVINAFLETKGFPTQPDQTTWKYYMNLAGDYHVADRAELTAINRVYEPNISDLDAGHIRIKVAGNNGPVFTNLTKDLLYGVNADTAIADEYNVDGPFFNELITKYPNQLSLILGILNPIDYAITLNAADNTILYAGGFILTDTDPKYPTYSRVTGTINADDLLIADNEMNLIPLLQEQINNYFIRWYNPFFSITNNLYYSLTLSGLYGNLWHWIMMIRVQNAKTEYAHMFHIRSYLDSFGKLGEVTEYLPLKPLLFLYRNLRYLEANFGKQKTFDLLVENVATPSKISLQRYDIKHNLTSLVDNLVPLVELERVFINPEIPGVGTKRRFPEEIINKETKFIDAFKDLDADLSIANTQIDNAFSIDNAVYSKVIESEMLDDFDSGVYSLTGMLFNYWGYLASTDQYKGSLYVTQPATGERLLLTPKAAFILCQYCINKGYFDYTLDKVPAFNMDTVAKTPKPLLAYVQSGCIPQLNSKVSLIYAEQYTGSQLAFSPTAFFALVEKHYREVLRRWYIVSDVEVEEDRAMLQNAMNKLYWENEVISFDDTGEDFDLWLTTQGVKLDDLSKEDFQTLAKSLIETACGLLNNPNRKLPFTQAAVINVLRHFSAYNVQFLKSINTERLAVAGWSQLRVLDYSLSYEGDTLAISHSVNLPVVVDTGFNEIGLSFDTTEADANLSLEGLQYSFSADVGTVDGDLSTDESFIADSAGMNDSVFDVQ